MVDSSRWPQWRWILKFCAKKSRWEIYISKFSQKSKEPVIKPSKQKSVDNIFGESSVTKVKDWWLTLVDDHSEDEFWNFVPKNLDEKFAKFSQKMEYNATSYFRIFQVVSCWVLDLIVVQGTKMWSYKNLRGPRISWFQKQLCEFMLYLYFSVLYPQFTISFWKQKSRNLGLHQWINNQVYHLFKQIFLKTFLNEKMPVVPLGTGLFGRDLEICRPAGNGRG